MTLKEFRNMNPKNRLAYSHANPQWLESLTPIQLDEVGLLLCHASPKHVREEMPIERDLTRSAEAKFQQDVFERSIFGTMVGNTTVFKAEDAKRIGFDGDYVSLKRGEMPSE